MMLMMTWPEQESQFGGDRVSVELLRAVVSLETSRARGIAGDGAGDFVQRPPPLHPLLLCGSLKLQLLLLTWKSNPIFLILSPSSAAAKETRCPWKLINSRRERS
jgi:hypothetical protein